MKDSRNMTAQGLAGYPLWKPTFSKYTSNSYMKHIHWKLLESKSILFRKIKVINNNCLLLIFFYDFIAMIN